MDRTKLIAGVRCLVVRDRVSSEGFVIEDTNDWFAQALDGTVWYCGEETSELETFDGDQPQIPELVSIEGHFKAGVNGDKPGRIFLASPAVGDVYREEFSLGNAEDMATVKSVTYRFGSDPDLDRLLPQNLADRYCAGDCVVTENTSQLEPGVVERKYYARGVGVILETDPDSGEVLQL